MRWQDNRKILHLTQVLYIGCRMVVSIDRLLLLGNLFVSDTGLSWDDLVIQKSVEWSAGASGWREVGVGRPGK
jgi:hypothetical protein